MHQKIREIRAERKAIQVELTAILAKAESEQRTVNEAEKKLFDERTARAEALGTELDALEELRDAKLASMLPRENFTSNATTVRDDDGQETRALLPGESAVTFLRSRGHIPSETSSVSLGQWLRSIVTGPRSDAERRALNETTAGSGGYTVAPVLAASLIDALSAETVVTRAGARIVPMTSQKHQIVRMLTRPTPGWIAEGDDVPESTATFDRVELVAKDVAVLVKVSRQLMMDASVNIESVLSDALIKSFANTIDAAALYGTGSSNQPTGLANISGINSVSMGTNGATFTATGGYDKLLDAVYQIELNNAGTASSALMHPRTAMSFEKLVGSDGHNLVRPDSIKALQFLKTTAVPINQTQGTETAASSILLGDFSRLLVGVNLSPRVEMTPLPILDGKLEVGFVCWARIDIAVEQPKAFTKLIGIAP